MDCFCDTGYFRESRRELLDLKTNINVIDIMINKINNFIQIGKHNQIIMSHRRCGEGATRRARHSEMSVIPDIFSSCHPTARHFSKFSTPRYASIFGLCVNDAVTR